MLNNNALFQVRKEKEDFLNSIRINQDSEKLILLKLQRDYEENKITEDDMTREQIRKLKELYNEQILKLQNDYKRYRKKALKLRAYN